MKRRQAPPAARVSKKDAIGPPTPAASPPAVAAPRDVHITAGNVLWTLTHNSSTAQARRWITPSGYELELLIWTGAHVEGQEDLCWSQLFASEDAVADAAVSKKRQLEASGWLEDIDTTAD